LQEKKRSEKKAEGRCRRPGSCRKTQNEGQLKGKVRITLIGRKVNQYPGGEGIPRPLKERNIEGQTSLRKGLFWKKWSKGGGPDK